MTTDTTAAVPVSALAAALRDLGRGGRWTEALALADAAVATDPAGRATLALAAAEIAMDATWFSGEDLAGARLTAADAAAVGPCWRLDFAHLRYEYFRQQHADGPFRPGPEGKDAAAMDQLRHRLEDLRDGASDQNQAGWASMYLGLVCDNLYGDRPAAPAHYEVALRAGRATGDPLLSREALRHLGDHDHDAGDHTTARERWQEATALGAGAGNVVGTLSQQMLLAVLARDTGDPAGADAIAAEVLRWTEALGVVRLADQARAFLAGDR